MIDTHALFGACILYLERRISIGLMYFIAILHTAGRENYD